MANSITPQDVFWNDATFNGKIYFAQAPGLPTGAISNSDIAASAGIAYTKIVGAHKQSHELFAEGASIVALASKFSTIVRGTSGTQVGLDVVLGSTMGAASSVNIDLQKSTIGSSAFGSVLSAPIALTSTSLMFTRYSATFASTGLAMAAGEAYRLVVTIGGTTSTAAKGLWATHTWSEAPA